MVPAVRRDFELHANRIGSRRRPPLQGKWRRSLKSSKSVLSKQELREETERLIKEAMERKALTIKQGDTRIEATCGKCGAKNRVSAERGQLRATFTCKECGQKQQTL
jgi:transcription elongation factor Elf1